MQIVASKSERARSIRDHALGAIAGRMTFQDVGAVRLASWEGNGFLVVYRTPFTKETDRDPALARQLRKAPRNYRLDIWHAAKKVLNVEWDDDDLLVVSFKPGAWEEEFLAV